MIFTRPNHTHIYRPHNKKWFCNISLTTILLVLLISGCATMKLPDYPKISCNSYKNIMEKENLQLSAKAMTDEADLEKYFGTDLSAQNVIPVHIVVENINNANSFVVSKDKISFNYKKEKDGLSNSEHKAAESHGGEAAVFAGTAALVIAPVLSPFLIVADAKALSDADVVKHNLATKEFQTRTISPGKSIDGFVYFSLPEGYHSLENWTIVVPVTKLGNNVTQEFVLALD